MRTIKFSIARQTQIMRALLVIIVSFIFSFSHAQMTNWYDKDAKAGEFMSISTNKAYDEIIPDRKPEQIIVAIIDSGVDAEHEDLKDVMWVNKGEMPDNGIDDDKNGYIDDINGWNFLGNSNGDNVHKDNLEMTRLYAEYHKSFKNTNSAADVPIDLIGKYQNYIEWKQRIKKERDKHLGELEELRKSKSYLLEVMDAVSIELGRDSIYDADLDEFSVSPDPLLSVGSRVLTGIKQEYKVIPTVTELVHDIKLQYDYMMEDHDLRGNYYYNPDLDTRKIIGDNYLDVNEKYYGNNDVEGPDALHGTHVAGIVAAVRDNEIGMNGVSSNARIMSVRVVPDGDERDKDVANGIYYAVDNGAKVINMSFGKGQSPYKEVVDKAVRYAEKKDVVMIHASGNDAADNDIVENYPSDTYEKGFGFLFFKKKSPKNWLEIGAVGSDEGKNTVATFSNYGKTQVDVFAPGLYMISTLPDDNYTVLQGTSMAAPVVSGIAAVIRGYFPDLKAKDVKKVIMESSIKSNREVIVPGTDGKTQKFSNLSVSGGAVNLYTAFISANKISKYGGELKKKSDSKKSVSDKKEVKAVEAGL